MLQPLRYWSVSHPHGTRTLLQFSSLIVFPLLFTSLLSDSLYFRSSFGPSTSIHVTLFRSLSTFVSAHPFQKFYPTKKEAFFLRTFLSLILKNFLIQKRREREREFYGYKKERKKEEEKISFLKKKETYRKEFDCNKFIKWMLSFITIYQFFSYKKFF